MVSIKVVGGRAAMGELDLAWRNLNFFTDELIKDVATDAVFKIQNQIYANNNILKGNLLKSVHVENVSRDEAVVKMNFYGLFVDQGTGKNNKGKTAKKAPPQLIHWVKIKGSDANINYYMNKYKISRDQAVRMEANRIRREGTKAYHIVSKGLDNVNLQTHIDRFIKEIEV